jgi:hypothetical protein
VAAEGAHTHTIFMRLWEVRVLACFPCSVNTYQLDEHTPDVRLEAGGPALDAS